jgi:hypothetical protein
MRLWTLHPRYLDPQGLVALWREALLARAVLRDETRGYKHHPQLERFRQHDAPVAAIDAYLAAAFEESVARGYSFDPSKIGDVKAVTTIATTSGQVEFEWRHLSAKLALRNPLLYQRWRNTAQPESHPLFVILPGPIEPWERGQRPAG